MRYFQAARVLPQSMRLQARCVAAATHEQRRTWLLGEELFDSPSSSFIGPASLWTCHLLRLFRPTSPAESGAQSGLWVMTSRGADGDFRPAISAKAAPGPADCRRASHSSLAFLNSLLQDSEANKLWAEGSSTCSSVEVSFPLTSASSFLAEDIVWMECNALLRVCSALETRYSKSICACLPFAPCVAVRKFVKAQNINILL
mmetsp:Transcript_15507/g.35469  ORF Transcript_15507/g.35469 Transcript_15507/m.35469 type:complete len:202 (+) Transcript_15507:1170-1775(+)